jgi:hypothetical protein
MSEPEKSDNSDNSDNAPKEAAEPTPVEEPPKEKKRGRPAGAKDRQPRATPKRKPKIVFEPLQQAAVEPPATEPPRERPVEEPLARPDPPAVKAPEPVPPQTLSPRSLLREAANLRAQYHRSRHDAKRQVWDAHFARLQTLHF